MSLLAKPATTSFEISVSGDVGGDVNIYIDTGTNGDTVTLEFQDGVDSEGNPTFGDLNGETNIAVLPGLGQQLV